MARKHKVRNLLFVIILFLVSGAFGFLVTALAGAIGLEPLEYSAWMQIIIVIFMLLVGLYLQTVIHELGHLVFGLLSGYKFVSFRIANLLIQRGARGVGLYRYSIAGTGGQCLLRPPAFDNGAMRYRLYVMGGSLMNLISVPLLVWFATLCRANAVASYFLFLAAFVGLILALINIVPLENSQLTNDGHDLMELGRDKHALYALWFVLEVNYQLAMGKRLRDLPEDWFYVPDEDRLTNSMVVACAVYYELRLMDSGEYGQAAILVDALRETDNAIPGLYWALLNSDRVTVGLMESDASVVDRLWTREQRKMAAALLNHPSGQRTLYAIAKLYDHDADEAGRCLGRFERICSRWPYPGDIECETAIMSAIDAASND